MRILCKDGQTDVDSKYSHQFQNMSEVFEEIPLQDYELKTVHDFMNFNLHPNVFKFAHFIDATQEWIEKAVQYMGDFKSDLIALSIFPGLFSHMEKPMKKWNITSIAKLPPQYYTKPSSQKIKITLPDLDLFPIILDACDAVSRHYNIHKYALCLTSQQFLEIFMYLAAYYEAIDLIKFDHHMSRFDIKTMSFRSPVVACMIPIVQFMIACIDLGKEKLAQDFLRHESAFNIDVKFRILHYEQDDLVILASKLYPVKNFIELLYKTSKMSFIATVFSQNSSFLNSSFISDLLSNERDNDERMKSIVFQKRNEVIYEMEVLLYKSEPLSSLGKDILREILKDINFEICRKWLQSSNIIAPCLRPILCEAIYHRIKEATKEDIIDLIALAASKPVLRYDIVKSAILLLS